MIAAPRPSVDRPALRREENEAVYANLVAAGGSSYLFACECGRSGCTERVELALDDVRDGERVLATGHAS